MKKLVFFLLLIFFSTNLNAEITTPNCLKGKAITDQCAQQVHAAGLKGYEPDTFEAYFDLAACNRKERTIIRYFGTDLERFRFEKCLAENGVPLDRATP